MNTSTIERVIFLAEDSVFKTSENLRKIVFSKQFASPQLEQIVQRMRNDLDVIVFAAREFTKEYAAAENSKDTTK